LKYKGQTCYFVDEDESRDDQDRRGVKVSILLRTERAATITKQLLVCWLEAEAEKRDFVEQTLFGEQEVVADALNLSRVLRSLG
jgi:hypothetical protein